MEILQLHPTVPRQRHRIEQFLAASGLRLDDVDYYAVLTDESTGEIIAGGGLKGAVVKCVAVADGHKGEAVANTMVSHLIAEANAKGYQCVKLFTKPQNRPLFESLSFRLLAEAPQAILMETGVGGIGKYCEGLRRIRETSNSVESNDGIECNDGIIIMNCNPFTLGHRYLIEQSAKQVRRLYIVVVREDCSMFSYEERKAMVDQGVRDLGNVVVCDGSDYSVSATTFPTYFLKQLSEASDTQMTLDIDIYRRHIAPALQANVRFVGSEPTDPLTRRYNELMGLMLPNVRELPRLEKDGQPVSASRVRKAIVENNLAEASRLVPPTTLPYIIAHLATRALKTELNTTPKPGLVDSHDSGAHRDMDHALMMRSIRAMHPYFVRLALLGYSDVLPCHEDIVNTGLEAEKAMFAATGGVNTYKGALFSMGLAVVAAAQLAHSTTQLPHSATKVSPQSFISNTIISLAARFPDTSGTHGSRAKQLATPGVRLKSALDNARDGYSELFSEWLPFYESRRKNADSYVIHRTLLRIMCDLDDTNIVYRTSYDTMQQVKIESRRLLEDFSEAGMDAMNRDFISRNISPGGSADMLSLVVFLYGVLRKQ